MNVKKLISMVLALVMLLAMSATAMAEETQTYSYEIYQIFTGVYSGNHLTDVKWGKNGDGEVGKDVDEGILEALETVNTSTSNLEKLEVILEYVNLESEPYETGDAATYTLPNGYYLVKDVEGYLDGKEDAYTTYVVEVVDNTLTIERKTGVPSLEKKVKDANDSTDTEDTVNDWQDSADHDINDVVDFKLTATLPKNYEDYHQYKLVFHDEMSEGLSFTGKDDLKVYIDGKELGKDDYSVKTSDLVHGQDKECTFEVVISDLKSIKTENITVTKESVITVEFKATLTEGAKIGAEGNPNTAYLEFSNNPNYIGDGTNEPTGETPEDTVIVFTYKVVVDKVDEDGDALAGAEFELYKKDSAGNEVLVGKVSKNEAGVYVVSGRAQVNETGDKFTWTGLDDGNYVIKETKAPAGYNSIADIEFTITAEHDVESDDPRLTKLEGGNMFTGEINKETGKLTGALTAEIENKRGATLPETGAQGTKMLYIVGGILVAAALVLLIVKRRMDSAE